jgi:hypothetical protein
VEEQARTRHHLHRRPVDPAGYHHPLAHPVHNQANHADLAGQQLAVALHYDAPVRA